MVVNLLIKSFASLNIYTKMSELLRLCCFVVPVLGVLFFIWFNLTVTIASWCAHLCVLLILPLIAWCIGTLLYDYANVECVSPENKAVFITGCDTGFGNLLARRLCDLGFHVFAGVLFPEGDGAQNLASKYPQQLHLIKLDVTSQVDVENAISQIRSKAIPLWAVVNNAGIAINAPWDWGHDVDDFKRVFEVNTLGPIRVAKNAVPLLRESRGRIVNVASAAGRIAAPHMCHYNISKFSVRVLSDNIRRDMIHDDIKVVTIEPAFYQTSIVNKEALRRSREAMKSRTPPEILKSYGTKVDKVLAKGLGYMDWIMNEDVNEVVNAMVKAVTLKHPRIFYRCTNLITYLMVWIGARFPEELSDFAMGGYLRN